ncbi:MAG: CHASE2 domain-containing protein, partial [Alphaproteobacteria bacterium]|nr:CHASE2 domain-containing protein [Alphaproteobacteria bacterium]
MTRARVAPAIVAVLVAAACVFLSRAWPLAAAAEDRLADLRAAAFAPHLPAQHPRVALVLVTEETLADLPYRSPVDRGLIAAAVSALGDLGVAGLGIDILFDRASEPEKDAALVAALKAFPAPVVLASAGAADGLAPAQTAYLDSFIAATGANHAVPALQVDPDGAVRRWSGGAAGFAATLAGESGRVPEADARIAFLGPPEDGADVFAQLPIHALPALAALNRAALEAALKGKIVLLGADLPGIDRHRTPLAARAGAAADMAGVEIHAHMLGQVLDGRRVGEAGPAAAAALILVLALLGVLLAHW